MNADELNRGLCTLARPALQFTTANAALWYLTVHGGPDGAWHLMHQFDFHSSFPDPKDDPNHEPCLPAPIDPDLAFLAEVPERPPSAFDTVAEDIDFMGGPVPAAFRDAVVGLPYGVAMRRYHDWHVSEALAALGAAGIPHDLEAVRRVLCWEGTTEMEEGSDIGNLPRLLQVPGLVGEWETYWRTSEADEPTGEAGPANRQRPAPAWCERLWRNPLADTCTAKLWEGTRDGCRSPCGVWGDTTSRTVWTRS